MQSTWKSVGWPFLAGIAAMVVAAVVAICSVRAEERNRSLPATAFLSSDGGAMIGGDNWTPAGGICGALFIAINPDGTIHYNMAALRAVETRGGGLCTGR